MTKGVDHFKSIMQDEALLKKLQWDLSHLEAELLKYEITPCPGTGSDNVDKSKSS